MSAQSLSGRSCDSKKFVFYCLVVVYLTVLKFMNRLPRFWHCPKAGAEVVFAAPNRDQHHVLNHLDGTEMTEKRNIRVEANSHRSWECTRRHRGQRQRYRRFIYTRWFGAAKNFCSFAFEGANAKVFKRISKASFKPYIDTASPSVQSVLHQQFWLSVSVREPSPLVRMQERLKHLKALAPHTKSVLSRRWCRY